MAACLQKGVGDFEDARRMTATLVKWGDWRSVERITEPRLPFAPAIATFSMGPGDEEEGWVPVVDADAAPTTPLVVAEDILRVVKSGMEIE